MWHSMRFAANAENISQKTEEKKSSRENTGGKRKTPSQSFHSKKKMLSDIYEAYAEGKIDKDTFLRKKENIREMFETEDVEAETKTAVVRTDLENLLEEVQSTADDSWLTREVLMVFSLLIASCLNAPIRVYSIGILWIIDTWCSP